jgi:hypothetical protein
MSNSTPNAVEGELLASDEPMPFNDRPYFRRLLDFDDLVRRGRPVTCESLAGRWKTSTKTAEGAGGGDEGRDQEMRKDYGPASPLPSRWVL